MVRDVNTTFPLLECIPNSILVCGRKEIDKKCLYKRKPRYVEDTEFLMRLSHSVFSFVSLLAVTYAHQVDVLSWDEAYKKADALLNQMTLEQKALLTTDLPFPVATCFGTSHELKNPDFPALCQEDASIGVHYTTNVSVFISGINAAATFDKKLVRLRAEQMGEEFRRKGVNIQLGPVIDIMRIPTAGRIWEAFGEDPYLTGALGAESILGVQSRGVVLFSFTP